LMPELTADDVANVVRVREALPYQNVDAAVLKARPELQKLKAGTITALGTVASAGSDFFSVSMAISSDSTQVRQTALLQRQAPPAWPRIIWVQTQ
ncbi:MAG TPA: hypothetical protein VF928_13665, partial [Usitatibacteraceae bacterium]